MSSGTRVGSTFLFLFLIVFAYKVWPTPYKPYVVNGVVDPTRRIVRLTGEFQAKDPVSGFWLPDEPLSPFRSVRPSKPSRKF